LVAAVVIWTCLKRSSSSFIGLLFAQIALALDQSKSTTPHPAVEAVEVKPLLLHGMMIVDEFIW